MDLLQLLAGIVRGADFLRCELSQPFLEGLFVLGPVGVGEVVVVLWIVSVDEESSTE